jgi:hypothetical protein
MQWWPTLCLVVCAVGCSAEAGDASSNPVAVPPVPTEGPRGASGATGGVGVQLKLAGGAEIDVLDWTIAGPDGAATVVQSSSVAVSGDAAARFLVGGVPSGAGYRISLRGTSTNGSAACSGAAPFAIAARATTDVAVQLACTSAASLACPAWRSLTASAIETRVGSVVTLEATASGPAPSALTYAWSATTGSLGTPGSATSTFTCTEAGKATVKLQVGDGPAPRGSACDPGLGTATVDITCDGGTVVPAPALPPWGLATLLAALTGIGFGSLRRRSRDDARFETE